MKTLNILQFNSLGLILLSASSFFSSGRFFSPGGELLLVAAASAKNQPVPFKRLSARIRARLSIQDKLSVCIAAI